jgi:hypothetical protein
MEGPSSFDQVRRTAPQPPVKRALSDLLITRRSHVRFNPATRVPGALKVRNHKSRQETPKDRIRGVCFTDERPYFARSSSVCCAIAWANGPDIFDAAL